MDGNLSAEQEKSTAKNDSNKLKEDPLAHNDSRRGAISEGGHSSSRKNLHGHNDSIDQLNTLMPGDGPQGEVIEEEEESPAKDT